MNNLNFVYNPDHQQVLEHHKDLLKKAEAAALVRSAMANSKQPHRSFRKLLQDVFSNRHVTQMASTVTRVSDAQPLPQGKH
jgi:cytochrome P450